MADPLPDTTTPEKRARKATDDALKELSDVKRDLTTTLVPGSAGGGEKARVIAALAVANEKIDNLTATTAAKDKLVIDISKKVEECAEELLDLSKRLQALQLQLRDISGR